MKKLTFKPNEFTCGSNQFYKGFEVFKDSKNLNGLDKDIKKIVNGISYLVNKHSINLNGINTLEDLLNNADLINDFEVRGIVSRVNCIINNYNFNFSSVNKYIRFLESVINTTSLVLKVDLEGNVKWANDIFCEVSGYELEELKGKSTKELSGTFNQEKPKEFWADLWNTIGSGKIWRGSIKNMRKNGDYFWSDTYIFPEINDKGEIVEYFVIRNDITETADLKDKYMFQALTLEKLNKELNEANLRLSEMALTDSLTGLYNRRSFDNRLSEVLAHASRMGTQFGLVLFDIDFFKKINDTFGHEGGDIVLRNLGNLMHLKLRADDFKSRIGGEEFALIICDTDKDTIFGYTERFRKNIEEMELSYLGKKIKISSSFGFSIFEKGDTMESVYRRADDALYKAKNNGRNIVEYIDKKVS